MITFPMHVTDHLGRNLYLPAEPQRIISLCPSQTETLVALGLGDRLVGKTRFCIHPKEALQAVQNIGGTKEVKFDRLRALKPDLIIGEKEENTPEMIAVLEKEFPVYVTDVRDLDSAHQMILDLGLITGTSSQATDIAQKTQASISKISGFEQPVSCLYFIWKDPWMVVGADTFIDSVLKKCQFDNLGVQMTGRYPMFDKNHFSQKSPQVILLSSEPYPFKIAHFDDVKRLFPSALIRIVDGEMFSWYGSHMIGVEKYVELLVEDLKNGLILRG